MKVYTVEYDVTNDPLYADEEDDYPFIGQVFNYPVGMKDMCINDENKHFKTVYANVAEAYQQELSNKHPHTAYTVKEINE